MNESELQAAVIDLARILGWRVAHFRPAMTSHGWRTPVAADGKGFPDLLMVRGARIIAVELKAAKGKPTPEQLEWLEVLGAAGVPSYIWRPADLDDGGMILATLR